MAGRSTIPGVTSMLFYPDVTSIIAFINTENALKQDSNGNIVVDSSVPALFGYQAYNDKVSPPYAPRPRRRRATCTG